MKKCLVIALALAALPFLAFSQDYSLDPLYGSVELEWGFDPDPHVVEVEAGGSIDISDIGYYGFVNEAPDFDLYYEAGDYVLTIKVECKMDTVLLVNTPDGDWVFSDDENGLNPSISFSNPQSGLYDIWIGTVYSTDGFPDGRLIITELEQ